MEGFCGKAGETMTESPVWGGFDQDMKDGGRLHYDSPQKQEIFVSHRQRLIVTDPQYQQT